MALKLGPPNERPKPKPRKDIPPIKSQAVMVITIDKSDTLQLKTFGEGDAKIILDAFVDEAREALKSDDTTGPKLRLVP